MKFKYTIYIINFLTLLLLSASAFSKSVDERLEFSGFTRVVLGYLDESNATYLGYGNSLSLSQQSLLAVQADYQIHDKLSFTTQLIAHSGDERDSGVEWLYFTYEPTRSSQIKLGRQRTPFFNYSDVIDVGFSYPWITLPQQVYSSVYFSTFDGVLAGYEWNVNGLILNIEAFGGTFDGDIVSSGTEVEADIDNLRGLIFNLQYDNFSFRSAYHRTDAIFQLDELIGFSDILQQSGFTQSAESLTPNGKIEFFQIGASYETLDYFLRTEVTKIEGESNVVPEIDSYFIAAGYNFFPYTSYISFAKTKSTLEGFVNEIPLGINDQLNGLSAGFDFIVSQLTFDSSESITIGTRFDWKSNLAIKAEVTLITAEEGSTANFDALNERFDRQAPLYQLALEWVF